MTALHQAAQKAVSLTDEQIERLAIQSGLDEELWFGKYTPAGYEDTLPKLRRFLESALQQQPEPVAGVTIYLTRDPATGEVLGAAPPALQEVPREPVADKRRVAMETVYFRRGPNEPWDSLTVLAGTATQHVREELIESIVSAADGIAASPSTTQQQEAGSGFWWCAQCQCEVPSRSVTYEETHDVRAGGCGHPVGDCAAAPSTPAREEAGVQKTQGPYGY